MKQLELPIEITYTPTRGELNFLYYLNICEVGTVISVCKQSKEEIFYTDGFKSTGNM